MANKSTYLEMVSDAIVTLKESKGSSQYAIGKFIKDKYKDLSVNFKKMLLIQLKKLVASDKLVKVKASYKLPFTAKLVAAAKRKKGAAPAKKKSTAPAKTKAAPAKVKRAPKAKPAPKAKRAPKAKPAAKAKPAPKPKPTAEAKPVPKAKAKSASKAKPAANAKRPAEAKPAATAKPIFHQQVQTNRPDELAQVETTVVTVEAKYKNRLESFSFEVPATQTTRSSERFIKLKE